MNLKQAKQARSNMLATIDRALAQFQQLLAEIDSSSDLTEEQKDELISDLEQSVPWEL